MRVFYAVLLVVFIVAIAIFCFQNMQTIAITYLGWSISAPLPIVVLLVYVLGMVTGWGVLDFVRRSIRRATEARH